jgi:putative membrane-bound dehydrogenase-like protein
MARRPGTAAVAALALLAATSAARSAADPQAGPRSPEESQACFELVPGHVVELVAAEPLVFDPVAICWDAHGRLHVAEMSDYPRGGDPEDAAPAEPRRAGGGRIVVLDDTDGDGRLDRRTILAEGLAYPNGLMPWRDGILVTTAPDILWLRDADGDGHAEIREVVLTGFGTGNPQLRVNGLSFAADGWVYAANGRSGGSVSSPRRPAAPPVAIDRHDVRFRPDTGEVEAVAGFSQFGLAIDPCGERFSNWNTAPIRHVVFPLDVARRHPEVAPATDMEVLADPGCQDRVFPVSPTPVTFNRESTDAFNASCGPAIDTGGLLQPPGCLYVCEPLLNVVHRRQLVPRGATFEARRPDGEEAREFLASRDPWFRPVFTAAGPDGGLWICDFYRRWVEHPDFVRQEGGIDIAWDEGRDRGRIWRVRPAAVPLGPVPRLGSLGGAELAARLRAPTGWERTTAHRLLVERAGGPRAGASRAGDDGDREAVARVAAEPACGDSPAVRATVIAAACGLGLEPPPLHEDDDPRLRRLIARLTRETAGPRPALPAHDPDAGVRFELALAAEAEPPEIRADTLLRLFTAAPADPWVDTAAAAVAGDAAPAVIRALLATTGGMPSGPRHRELLRLLAAACGSLPERSAALEAVVAEADADRPEVLAVVAGWLRGRRAAGLAIDEVFAGRGLKSWSDAARRAVALPPSADGTRSDAIAVLAADADPAAIEPLIRLLAEPADAAATAELLAAVRGRDDPRIAEAITTAWPAATPAARRELLGGLLRPSRMPTLLRGLLDGTVAPGEVDPESRARLLAHEGLAAADQEAVLAMFGGRAAADRAAVVARVAADLPATGCRERGAAVFVRHCGGCHRSGDTGARVGPDLAGLAAKSRETILEDILDPNRRVAGEFLALVVVTNDGESIVGLPAGETPTTLLVRTQGGGLETVPRTAIETLRGTGRSLMPEGFEQAIAPPEFADLIAFLRGSP